jgi:hypothetical protein
MTPDAVYAMLCSSTGASPDEGCTGGSPSLMALITASYKQKIRDKIRTVLTSRKCHGMWSIGWSLRARSSSVVRKPGSKQLKNRSATRQMLLPFCLWLHQFHICARGIATGSHGQVTMMCPQGHLTQCEDGWQCQLGTAQRHAQLAQRASHKRRLRHRATRKHHVGRFMPHGQGRAPGELVRLGLAGPDR